MSGVTQSGSQGSKSGAAPRQFWSVAAVRWLLPIVTVAGAVILGKLLDYYWQSTPFTSLFICAILIGTEPAGSKLLALPNGSYRSAPTDRE
jgi:hypothetical protein